MLEQNGCLKTGTLISAHGQPTSVNRLLNQNIKVRQKCCTNIGTVWYEQSPLVSLLKALEFDFLSYLEHGQ